VYIDPAFTCSKIYYEVETGMIFVSCNFRKCRGGDQSMPGAFSGKLELYLVFREVDQAVDQLVHHGGLFGHGNHVGESVWSPGHDIGDIRIQVMGMDKVEKGWALQVPHIQQEMGTHQINY